jgi:hypothetical protein
MEEGTQGARGCSTWRRGRKKPRGEGKRTSGEQRPLLRGDTMMVGQHGLEQLALQLLVDVLGCVICGNRFRARGQVQARARGRDARGFQKNAVTRCTMKHKLT